MAITKVQSVTGGGPTLVLNGVVAGNCLTYQSTYFRGTSTGVAEAVPTDSNGTFTVGRADTPSVLAPSDTGASGFFQKNCAAGTHTVTPEANSGFNGTLTEWSGVDTVSPLITGNSGKNNGTGTSQSTGASASASSGDLSLIQHGMGATTTGVANVGYTDPVANYTTLQINTNDQSNIATLHCFRVLSASGTETATFNWTNSEADQFWQASIFVLKAASSAAPDQIWAYFPDESEDVSRDQEPWDWVFNSPLPADTVLSMAVALVYDSTLEQEQPDDEPYGFELWLTPADTVMSAYLVYDSTLEQEQPDDEAFGYEFWVTPFDADQTLQSIYYDSSSEQEQPDDESFGFTDNPLLSEVDYILVEDGSLSQEDEEVVQDFIDTFAVNNVVIAVDLISVEDASWMQEDDEAIVEFLDNFVVNNPDVVPGTGSVIVFYDGLNVANGLNYHKDLSRPVVILVPVGDGTYTVTKVTDTEEERVGLLKETVTIDGDIP